MKTAVIYARYSSERQTEQSIEGQLRVCQDYADRNDILIVDTYIDRAMTGTNDNRKDFQRMLKNCSKQAWDYVLVYKLDRFSRNKYEMAMHKKTLRDNGIKLLSAMENIPDTPEGIILESLLEGMAEYYSAELSQKVRRGMNESRQKGQFTGGFLLYGYKVENKKVLIDEDKAKVIRQIYEQYASGVFVKDIIDELTANGILHNGKPFAKNTVYKMLKNEKYAGIVRYKDEVFTNIYPRIIPEDIFLIVRKKVEENHYGKHNPDVIYLLKNKLKCGICNSPISSETGTARDGTVRRYYKCLGKKLGSPCDKSQIRKDIIEKLVIDTTFKIFNDSENILTLAKLIVAKNKERMKDESKSNILIQEQNELTKSINNLLSCMEQGIITSATKNRLEELETRLEDINKQLLLEQTKEKTQVTKEDIVKYIKTALKKDSAQLIRLLIKEVVLYDDKVEIYYNYIDNKRRPDGDNHQAFSFYQDIFTTTVDRKEYYKEAIELKLQLECFCS